MFKKILVITFLAGIVSIYAQVGLSLQGSLAVPTDKFANSANTGFGGNATFIFNSSSLVQFTGSLGYLTFDAASDLPEGTDYSLSVVPLMAGLRYQFYKGAFNPYLGAELGVNFLSESITNETSSGPREVSESETQFGFNPLFGFNFYLTDAILLDATIKYHLITTDPTSSFFGIHAGLQFAL